MESATLKMLVDHHQAGLIPNQNLDPITALGAEERAIEGAIGPSPMASTAPQYGSSPSTVWTTKDSPAWPLRKSTGRVAR